MWIEIDAGKQKREALQFKYVNRSFTYLYLKIESALSAEQFWVRILQKHVAHPVFRLRYLFRNNVGAYQMSVHIFRTGIKFLSTYFKIIINKYLCA